MKNLFYFILILFIISLVSIDANAQVTITGSCKSGNTNSVTISNGTGAGNALYPGCGDCGCGPIEASGYEMLNLYTLYQLVNGAWTQQGASNQTVSSFNNLAPGTYQVVGQIAQVYKPSWCPNGITADFEGDQGYIGTYVTYTSNTVYIGIPSLNDVQASFIGDGGSCGAALYNITNANLVGGTKNVKLSTTGTNPYEAYALYINEGCSPNRWVPQPEGPGAYSAGWVNGAPPSNINISAIWYDVTGGGFNDYCQYTIQYVISNGGCGTGWYEKDYAFTIEPSNSPCELTDADAAAVSLSPNPASSSFRLNNVLFTPEAEYHLNLTDMSGRLVRDYENVAHGGQDFDISEIGTGLYVAALWNGSERIFTTKLSVSR